MAEKVNATNNSDASEIIDPNCLAEKPVRVTFRDVTSASFIIKSGVEYTPCSVNDHLFYF